MRYNRASIESTVGAAIKTRGDRAQYVFATAMGFTISRQPPPFGQKHVVVGVDGTVQTIPWRRDL